MNFIDKKRLFRDLSREYRAKHRKSKEFFQQSNRYLIRGGSHSLRLSEPFPFYDVDAQGARVQDLDGNTIIDFWQGHFANILGHNPGVVTRVMKELFGKGEGLVTGFPGVHQKELAEAVLKRIKAEKIRFTTSGSLASMYSIMLAKAYTGRDLVMKIGGGWHGSQPYALKGISVYSDGLQNLESAGLPSGIDSSIVITRFNDVKDLESKFKSFGSRTACLIMEPFIGAGGFIFGHKGYLEKARRLTRKYGALLILDEVISGFRFCPGGVQSLYPVEGDLTVLGKAIGGGMPVSAVAGREDILRLCSPDASLEEHVKFEGGTFSAHPAAMVAGAAYVKYLTQHAEEIYPRIGRLGYMARQGIEAIFRNYGFSVYCSGYNPAIVKGSSLVGVHFLNKDVEEITSPEQVWNTEICDIEMREKIFKMAMLNEGFNIFHGYGGISSAHTEKDIQASLDAVDRIAQKFLKYKK